MYGAPNDFRQYAEASYEQDILAHDLLSNRTVEAAGKYEEKWETLVRELHHTISGLGYTDPKMAKALHLESGNNRYLTKYLDDIIAVLRRDNSPERPTQHAIEIANSLRAIAPYVQARLNQKNSKNAKRYGLSHSLDNSPIQRDTEAGGDKWRQLVEQFYNIVGGGVIGDKSWKLTQGGTDPVAVISVLTRLTRNSTSLSDSDKQRALDILAQLRSMAPMVARRMTMKNDKNNKRYDNTVQSVFRHKEKRSKA